MLCFCTVVDLRSLLPNSYRVKFMLYFHVIFMAIKQGYQWSHAMSDVFLRESNQLVWTHSSTKFLTKLNHLSIDLLNNNQTGQYAPTSPPTLLMGDCTDGDPAKVQDAQRDIAILIKHKDGSPKLCAFCCITST